VVNIGRLPYLRVIMGKYRIIYLDSRQTRRIQFIQALNLMAAYSHYSAWLEPHGAKVLFIKRVQ